MSQLKFIQPTWPAPSHVKALITTRSGGVSSHPFGTLNLAMHVNDDKNAVIANRQRLAITAGLSHEPVWLNQIHGVDILDLDAIAPSEILQTDVAGYDGSITSKRNHICVIMSADCLPLFLCDEIGDQVALLHVGWRGLADGIIENGIKLFRNPPDKILAWAGPCIGADRFEIGLEVRDQLGGAESAFKPSQYAEDKFFANLYQLTGDRLAELGVESYGHGNYCTYDDNELFFSHRRDQKTGRIASLIWKA